MWDRSPMRHFGRTARMVGFRQTFRDLVGDIVIEDEADDRAEPTMAAAPVERDWAAEIAEAQSLSLLEQIEKDGRSQRVFSATPEGTALWRQLRDHKKALAAEVVDAWAEPGPAEAVEAAGDVERKRPQDYLPPANRAARRKVIRKKGGKR